MRTRETKSPGLNYTFDKISVRVDAHKADARETLSRTRADPLSAAERTCFSGTRARVWARIALLSAYASARGPLTPLPRQNARPFVFWRPLLCFQTWITPTDERNCPKFYIQRTSGIGKWIRFFYSLSPFICSTLRILKRTSIIHASVDCNVSSFSTYNARRIFKEASIMGSSNRPTGLNRIKISHVILVRLMKKNVFPTDR